MTWTPALAEIAGLEWLLPILKCAANRICVHASDISGYRGDCRLNLPTQSGNRQPRCWHTTSRNA